MANVANESDTLTLTNRFIVYPRPRTARRDQLAFKVKSVLRGTEHEGRLVYLAFQSTRTNTLPLVARHELVTFLHQQIAEQKRIDASFSGVPSVEEGSSSLATPKDVTSPADVQLVLPSDAKKQRKQTKQILLDRGIEQSHSTLHVAHDFPSIRVWGQAQRLFPSWWCAGHCGGCSSADTRPDDPELELDYRRRFLEGHIDRLSDTTYSLCPPDPRGSNQAQGRRIEFRDIIRRSRREAFIVGFELAIDWVLAL